MKYIWWIVYGAIGLCGVYAIYAIVDTVRGTSKSDRLEDKKKFEQTYFQGQCDALNGDLRIKKVDNRTYVWIKSPYSDTTKPYADTMYVEGRYKDSTIK